MILDHAKQFQLVKEAVNVLGYSTSIGDAGARLLQALQLGETSYSQGWYKKLSNGTVLDKRGSNNMGAVQAGKSWNGAVFVWIDSHASGETYQHTFRAYLTPLDGVVDAVKIATRTEQEREALARGDYWAFCRALYAAKYYEGYGATESERITGKAKAMHRDLTIINKALGVAAPAPFLVTSTDNLIDTGRIRRCSVEIQEELKKQFPEIVVDGIIGPQTLKFLQLSRKT